MTKNYTLNANIKAPFLPIKVNTICQIEKIKMTKKYLLKANIKTPSLPIKVNAIYQIAKMLQMTKNLHDEGLY